MDAPKYKVWFDSREQTPWNFPASGQCIGAERRTLKTGDYTLEGHEDKFVIERKGSSGEVAQNIVQDRFERELERLELFPHAFVVMEFTLADIIQFPINSGIPKARWDSLRITPQFFLKRLNEFQLRFRTKFVFAGSHGRELCSSLFKRVVEYGSV